MVGRHTKGKKGERGVDLMARMFGELIGAMDDNEDDLLGDLFQGAITYGEDGQYFTPDGVSRLMAQISVDPEARPSAGKPIYIHDPCCGTGRMLLEASKVNPHAELIGQDIDPRCVKITAINLGLRSRYGWVICGNSLSGETQFAYRIGSLFHETPNGLRRGVIREAPIDQTPVATIARGTRGAAQELFEEKAELKTPSLEHVPTIIEVPQWLARLEPGLAAAGRTEQVSTAPPCESQLTSSQEPEEPRKQQTLF
ncbi:MAG TPA: N-6 DNA methylase [Pirellulales bacterium]|nr:N-6 DNA methylase [Pirellulales bacterium]